MNKINNKAFTLIELIVVIAILGVLVLLAAPKFLGYTEDAKLVQIKNDVKIVENALEIELIEDPDFIANKGWEIVTLEKMNSYVEEGSLFDTKGVVSEELGGEFYVVEEVAIKSNLNGQFIASSGKVYYYEDGLNVGGDDKEENVYVATDDDFEWVNSTGTGTYYKDGQQGHFKYVGTGQEIIEIPHVIDGIEMTSYYRMFFWTGEDVKKVVSTNESITTMSYMFYHSQATELDLSSFDTSSVTDMREMFRESQATSLDLSSFDTSSVTDMTYMFYGSQATELDLSSFDTSNVTNMSVMFSYSRATTLDLSSFDTSKVTNMNHMFNGSKATTLDLSSFDTSSVRNMRNMFYNSQATTLDLSSFDTSKVTYTEMSYMFQNSQATTCYAKTQADADRFNNSSNKPAGLTFTVKPGESSDVYMAMDEDFSGTSNGSFRYIGTGQSEIEIPHVIKGVPVTSYSKMFENTGEEITKVVSTNPNVTNMYHMFRQSQATTLDLSSFNTSNVTNMNSMFYGSHATTLDLSLFDTSNVTSMISMFDNSQTTELDLSSFDTSNVTNMIDMFYRSQVTTLDLSSFDTSKVTNMSSMFRESQATTLDLSSFDTSKVTDMSYMFRGSQATSLDLSSFNTSKVTNMNSMFYQSQATTGYARTQADANKFNGTSLKPAGLNFIVKS